MRKGFLGSIAALAAGAGAAWGQPPASPGGPPVGFPTASGAPAPPLGGPPSFGGLPSHAIPGNAGHAPPPVIMPPGNYGPPGDPLGLGPIGGFGPPPSPMYPMPGPPGAQSYQPSPPMPGGGLGSGGLANRLSGRHGGNLGYGAAPHWWIDGEYLLWFTRGQPINSPLLTTSAPSDAGLPGAASTVVLVGNRNLGYNAINGLRLAAGFFGDADRRFGFQLGGFLTERRANTQTFGGASNTAGIPVLARPFIDSLTGAQSSIVLSGPDFGPAGVVVGTNTQTLSIEPSAVWNLYRSEPGCRTAWSVDFLAGYRFLQVKEELFVQTRTTLNGQANLPIFQFQTGPFGIITQIGSSVLIPAQTTFGGVNVIAPEAVIDTRDSFRVTNRFNGASFGLRGEARYGMVTTSAFSKISIGNMHERLEIFGGGSFFDPSGRSGSAFFNQPQFVQPVDGRTRGATFGGVLANNGNIGTFVQDRFSYIPEVGGTVGIALTRGLTGFIGVNLLYIPEIARPGDQISPVLNSAAIPFSPNFGAAGAPRTPVTLFDQTEFWLGGVSFGLSLRY